MSSLATTSYFFHSSVTQSYTIKGDGTGGYKEWFLATYDDSNGDVRCTQTLEYYLTASDQAGNCMLDNPLNDSRFTMASSADRDITFDLTTGYRIFEFCIMVKTIGGVKLGLPIKVENCGDEIISLLKPDHEKVKRLYHYGESEKNLIMKKMIYLYTNEGFQFVSDRPNCPVTEFKIYQDPLLSVEFTGEEFKLTGDTTESLALTVKTDKPWNSRLYVAANSLCRQYSPPLIIDIWICGYEKITKA